MCIYIFGTLGIYIFRREQKERQYLKKHMAETFPESSKDVSTWVTSSIIKEKSKPRNIVVKLQKMNDKEKNLKTFQRGKDRLPTKESNQDDRIVSSTTRAAKREWRNIFKVPEIPIQSNHHLKERAKERHFQIYKLTIHELLLKEALYDILQLKGGERNNGMQRTIMGK